MPTLSVVIPTISGREKSFDRAFTSYEETLKDGPSFEIIPIKDFPSWPAACNEGFRRSEGEIVHFTADDLEALPGWWERAIEWPVYMNELPAPRVYDYLREGKFANESDGEDGDITWFTRIPIMSRNQWNVIGPWPEIDYYADLWVSEQARSLGIETRMIYGYDFVHHWSQIGRVDTKENLTNSGIALDKLRKNMRGYQKWRKSFAQ